MSTIAISYSSLTDSQNEAKAVARRLDDYADSLSKTVYKKLNRYDGESSGNITAARNKINSKITELRSEADRYNTYASNLRDLRSTCKSTDVSVKSKVSSLTASFKARNDIRNSKVQNVISYYFTRANNSTVAGRWIGDTQDKIGAGKDYIKSRIKEWYNYEGGKEYIQGWLDTVFDIAIAISGVITAIIAFVAGGSIIVFIAALIGASIAIADGIVNAVNETQAYKARQNGDPATGMRRSRLDTAADTMMTDSDEQWKHNFAKGLKVTAFVCEVIDLLDGISDLMKNGFKWATGDPSDLTDISMKDVLSKDSRNAFKMRLGERVDSFITDFNCAKELGDFSDIVDNAINFAKTDFINNLAGEYVNFDTFEDGVKTTKNLLGVQHDVYNDILEGEFGLNNLETVGKNIIVPGLTGGNLGVFELFGNKSDVAVTNAGSYMPAC